MANWIEIPGPMWVNLDQIERIQVMKLTNPTESYRVMGFCSGGPFPLADDIYDKDKAEQVAKAIISAGGTNLTVVSPDLRDEGVRFQV